MGPDELVQRLRKKGITDERVLAALRRVPRERFVPVAAREMAYADEPLPIGCGQTISQPYIVALMTQGLKLEGAEKVLEVGTGSGYQTAVLAELAEQVFTIEIVPELTMRAMLTVGSLGYTNVQFAAGDGYKGWPAEAPFDAILVAAASPRVPEPLLEQLKEGGRLAIPLGETEQRLLVLRKMQGGPPDVELSVPVRFVPMVGAARGEWRPGS